MVVTALSSAEKQKKRMLPFDSTRPLWLYDAVMQAEYTTRYSSSASKAFE